jgi:predicted transcriptional regulator
MTMNKKQLAVTYVILDTLGEAPEIIEGHLYAAVMNIMGLEEFQSLLQALKGANVIQEKSKNVIEITPKGMGIRTRMLEAAKAEKGE